MSGLCFYGDAEFYGLTNTSRFEALYSLKNRKFIKGYIEKPSVRGRITYRLYPGRYIRFVYDRWNKRDPPYRIHVATIAIVCEQEKAKMTENEGGYFVVEFYHKEFLNQFPPQIIDFYEARPMYHGAPSRQLFEKIYSEEEHRSLLQLLAKKMAVMEGEENE